MTGTPVDKMGLPLPPHTKPPAWNELDPENPWDPFEDRLAFDFAHYHYVELQSPASKINKGLDLWLASKIQALRSEKCDNVPWASADELYETVDKIQQGNAPFRTFHYQYHADGPLPENSPAWMTQPFELCVRDSRHVLHHQLATPDFANSFAPVPYRQFQADGDRVWSDLFSADWAYREAVIKGTFKDHLVEWVMEYLHHEHGEARALAIIADIDCRISAVPAYPGLRRFEEGRDFAQWTGDDSKALMKMLVTITRLDKIAAMRQMLNERGLLQGTTAMAMALLYQEATTSELVADLSSPPTDADGYSDDVGPVPGPRLASSIVLCTTAERQYPKRLHDLATHLREPQFTHVFLKYLFAARNPTVLVPPDIANHLRFFGKIHVHHSAVARFYAPSDACGAGGMQRQVIRCNPKWRDHPRRDIVFIAESDEPGMRGLGVAQLLLLFSFVDLNDGKTHKCALVNWFTLVSDEPDEATGMWVVEREEVDGVRPLQVVSLDAVVRGAHLLPVFGNGRLPE
ncbi:hypothetical protein EST38_g9754 [Candolleomyces aberdarensis]|uniref:Uncharacterized protein n=1 Tax=Candolleomyces aberdarensis TaxID=2316362 RepID=A0A4Q2DCE2_9AGAR|nr:hypothetical protein EST38_g9754 [Candolleomyces aberdarensis]